MTTDNTEQLLQNAETEIATALTMWRDGYNASEVLQVVLNAQIELNNALDRLRAHVGD